MLNLVVSKETARVSKVNNGVVLYTTVAV
jgi:hypothetical protein